MKKFLYVTLISLSLIFFISCDDSNSDPVDDQTAMQLFTKASSIADSERLEIQTDVVNSGDHTSTTYNISKNAGSVIVTGTSEYNTTTKDFSFNVIVTFTNFTDQGATISGTIQSTFSGNTGSTDFTATTDADLEITYNGKNYDLAMDLGINSVSGTTTISGSYVINGQTYSANQTL